MSELNETHHPQLKSWVESANQASTHFPVQNLPLGVFRRRESDEAPRVGCAIGDQIFDISAAAQLGLFEDAAAAVQACRFSSLNALMSLGQPHWTALRRELSRLLREGSPASAESGRLLAGQAESQMGLPANVGDYTDFYASIHHATNVGSMFRPDNPLLPNYKHIPIGYHGRASSLMADGSAFKRPLGQTKADEADEPVYGPCKLLDYELEVGFFVGPGNPSGQPIPIDKAGEHIFGLCLVNDWSARDIQKWEYQPLGPFLAKSFATTVSPWVVTAEALQPYRVEAFQRSPDDPQPLPYLDSPVERRQGGIGLTVEAHLLTEKMREDRQPPHRLSRASFAHMYWTIGQMLAHHSSNGCNLRPGDLMASGTVSGPQEEARGCLLELTWRGSNPIKLPNGQERRFLQDGDEVILTGYCEAEGRPRVGLGQCRGRVLPAD